MKSLKGLTLLFGLAALVLLVVGAHVGFERTAVAGQKGEACPYVAAQEAALNVEEGQCPYVAAKQAATDIVNDDEAAAAIAHEAVMSLMHDGDSYKDTEFTPTSNDIADNKCDGQGSGTDGEDNVMACNGQGSGSGTDEDDNVLACNGQGSGSGTDEDDNVLACNGQGSGSGTDGEDNVLACNGQGSGSGTDEDGNVLACNGQGSGSGTDEDDNVLACNGQGSGSGTDEDEGSYYGTFIFASGDGKPAKSASTPRHLLPVMSIQKVDVEGNLQKETVKKVIANNLQDVVACYNFNTPKKDDPQVGEKKMVFYINQNGKVDTCGLDTTMENFRSDLSGCLCNEAQTWYFPDPATGIVKVEMVLYYEVIDVDKEKPKQTPMHSA